MESGYRDLKDIPRDIAPHQVVSVPTGAYAVVTKKQANDAGVRLLSSTGFSECRGCLATAIDSVTGQPIAYALTHLTIYNDEAQTIANMVRDLRGDDTSINIRFDLVGGDRGFSLPSPAQSSRDLGNGIIRAIEKLPNAQINNNHMEDLTFSREIAVDLKSDQKYGFSRDLSGHTIADVTEHIMDNYTDGNLVSVAARGMSSNRSSTPQTTRLPAIKFDWESCVQDIQDVWQAHRMRILNNVREELGEMNGRVT